MSGSAALTIMAIAVSAALASVVGGLIALWRKPTTLFMSLALGFAGGVLFAAISFEMLPQALELAPLPVALGGFAVGFVGVYAFDLLVHRGQVAGEHAQQHEQVERFHRVRRPRGTEVTVLAGGTSVEELIEGLSIGVGAVIDPSVGVVIGIAIAIDNLSEGMSIGELALAESTQSAPPRRRILGWTATVGAAVLASTLVGWFFLRTLDSAVLAFLLAMGAGGMLYLTASGLIPEAHERHYQQSATLAMAAGFILIFALSNIGGGS